MNENEISKIIIGKSIEIHKELGPGLLENVYERCLFEELRKDNLFVEIQKPIPINFKGKEFECGYRSDLIVDNKVIVEVKAIEAIHDIHIAQTLTYLKFSKLKLGLLINFNVTRLINGVRRVVNGL